MCNKKKIMDYEVKEFLLKYLDNVDEDIYLSFIKKFSKRPAKLIKKEEIAVYKKCKLFVKEKTSN